MADTLKENNNIVISDEEYYIRHSHYLCDMVGEMFRYATKKGFNPHEFIHGIIHTQDGRDIFNLETEYMFMGSSYMVECVTENIKPYGEGLYDADFMYWSGYLYKKWNILYKESFEEIYKQAPIDVLAQSFLGLHVMSYELAIEDLKNMYKEKNV